MTTIYPASHYPTFKLFKVVGGWQIWKLENRYTAVALERVYEGRDLAVRRVRRLNDNLTRMERGAQ